MARIIKPDSTERKSTPAKSRLEKEVLRFSRKATNVGDRYSVQVYGELILAKPQDLKEEIQRVVYGHYQKPLPAQKRPEAKLVGMFAVA